MLGYGICSLETLAYIGYVKLQVCSAFLEDIISPISGGEPDLSPNTIKPYKVNDQTTNQELELKHGQATRRFPMDKISNGLFLQVRRLCWYCHRSCRIE